MLKKSMKIGFRVIILFLSFIAGCSPSNTDEYIKDLKSENIIAQTETIFYLGEMKEKRKLWKKYFDF